MAPKIKIDRSLYEKLERAAADGGYASTDEFVRHVLERAADARDGDQAEDEEVEKQLRGLGYIE